MNSTIIIYLYWIFFSLIFLFYKNIKNYTFTLILLIISFFILLLSYKGLHSDWVSYRSYYNKAVAIGRTYFEKGFDFLLYIANKIGTFEVIPIFAILSFFLLFLVIWNERIFGKNNYYILVFSFYCSFLPLYFGAIRQAIASNFLFIFFVLFYKKKYLRCLFFLILAYLFHKSSILICAIFIAFNIYSFMTRRFNYKKYIFFTLLVVVTMYVVFKATISNLFVALDMAYRLGDADNFTSNPIKDLFILAERLIFIIFSFILIKYETKSLNFNIRLFLGGNFFYCIFYSLARNLAGRTLAFYRYLDIYIMYEALRIIIPRFLVLTKRKIVIKKDSSLNNVSLLFCIFYSLIKYYVTVASSGVF